jgi:hypothetical protein
MKTSNLIALLCVAVTLFSCKNKNAADYKALNAASSDTALVAADTTRLSQPKLIKTADLHFKVKNVQQTGENISALTKQYNGMVMHHNMTSSELQSNDVRISNDSVMRVSSFNTTADMTVKIPSEKIEQFLNTVSHMGIYVNERKMDIEDKSLDYLASQLKFNSRKELVSQQKTGRVVFKDPNSVLDLKDGLVDEQINNKMIDDQVKYSVISLSFYQSNTISKEIIANDDTSDYNLPFLTRAGMALTNGWYMFKELIIAGLNIWVLLVLGIGAWVLVRVRVYRKKVALQG